MTSKLGLHASKRWFYTLQLVANTQFAHSYKTNDPLLYADFLAPLNVNLSVGMDYNIDWFNHRLKGTAHFAPFAYNWKYTRNLELSSRLGIPEGKHFLHDFGSQFTFDTTWEFSDLFQPLDGSPAVCLSSLRRRCGSRQPPRFLAVQGVCLDRLQLFLLDLLRLLSLPFCLFIWPISPIKHSRTISVISPRWTFPLIGGL